MSALRQRRARAVAPRPDRDDRFGGAALILSCVGIYGVFSYAVGQRTREIGIRMALGQDALSVRNQVLLEGLRMTAVSTAIA
jgi:ABC-type antimicrobial peptide transport system permease subunit